MRVLTVENLQDPFLHQGRRGEGGRRRELQRRRRQGAGPGGRIRFRQNGDRLFDHGARRSAGAHRGRARAARRPQSARPRRRGDARIARQPHRDDLPGSDDDVESGAAHRHPDDGDRARAPDREPREGARTRAQRARPRRHPVARRAAEGLSASTLGRHAPARGDRDRAPEQPARDHRRRADHRARRHDPGADHFRSAEARARNRHRDGVDHARPVGDRGPRRRGVRHVRGPHRRVGPDRGPSRPSAASVYRGTHRVDSRAATSAASRSRRFPA